MSRAPASPSPSADAPNPHGPSSPSSPLVAALGLIALLGLAVITLASPGATRMYAWPWSLVYAATLLAPALALILRALDARRPLVLPAPAWTRLAIIAAGLVLASALASPYRGASLLWAAPLLAPLALFFVLFDWLHSAPERAEKLALAIGIFFAAVALASLGLWLAELPGRTAESVAALRNPFPLGHSNYTAGLALLALPWFALLGLRAPRPATYAWAGAIALAFALLLTSASRGALLGLGVLALATILAAPLDRRGKLMLAVGFALLGLALALAHPRTRAMFRRADPAAVPNISNVQRTAMLDAAWRMGADRPLLGWGPGTTPLAFPRYRPALVGGAENVLQLHSTPAQLWAELGAPAVLCALALALLVLRATRRHPAAAAALAGYALFALTDWQLDVPVFAFAVAACCALLAPPAPAATANPGQCHPMGDTSSLAVRALALASATRPLRLTLAGLALLALACIALLGRRDPAPEFNTRALALARDPAVPAGSDRALALLRESLALNPAQEIAHFNLGWLLVVRDPAAAEKHFLAAAHLVPDKGGVYFGLALARLNQNHPDAAARALALECLNDPAFLVSPWWREPALAALRDATRTEFLAAADRASTLLAPDTYAARVLPTLVARAPQLGLAAPGPERTYRRERTAYPVLTRQLDLPAPLDLYDVREPATPPADLAALPAKGWLPAPVLLPLVNGTAIRLGK